MTTADRERFKAPEIVRPAAKMQTLEEAAASFEAATPPAHAKQVAEVYTIETEPQL